MSEFKSKVDQHLRVIEQLKSQEDLFLTIAKKMTEAINNGGTIYWMGNGGSAADSQHLAAELIGRFKKERKSISSFALSTDTSILTCLSNDYDFSIVFARQLEAHCTSKDVVVGLSTSGNSKNILAGIEVAKARGAYTVGLTGKTGQKLAAICDDCLLVESDDTPRIQEGHSLFGHLLCEYIENNFTN